MPSNQVFKRDKFKSLLKTIFQYQQDRISLDFGVYRVFRHKAAQIESFLDEDLPRLVDEAAARHSLNPEDTYNDLLSFFARHYQDGDFFPIPQFGGEGAHALRHNGEETMFSWANQDQYYIKSLENFTEYRVRDILPTDLFPPERNVLMFTLGEVEELTGDQKKTRYFILLPKRTVATEQGVTLVFDYKAEKASAVTLEALHSHLAEKNIEIPLEVLAHHLNRFANLRRADFFIHRRLGAFLREQLNFFVKSEVVRLDEDYTLKRAVVVKETGEVVIAFLDKLEDLQKRLWEKKKFAHSVGYIITLDRIAQWAGEGWLAKRLPMILKRHREEWQDLGLGDYAKPKDLKIGDTYKPLPVDTRRFEGTDDIFKWDLLEAIATFGPIDGLLDGIAVHSDNWQSLSTFSARFRDRIKCFYIDPPYNTGTDNFPYKDGYPHSSWLSMITDRLRVARPLLTRNGAIFVSIDAKERRHLEVALDNTFGRNSRAEEIIWSQTIGSKNQSPTYSTNHEYVEVYARDLGIAGKDERMFRERKPGAADLLEFVESLNKEYPPIDTIQERIGRFFADHEQQLTEELEEQGIEYDKKEDPWNNLYNYKFAEYRDSQGKLVHERVASRKEAKIWVYMSDPASMPQGKQSETTKDSRHPNFRFYKPLYKGTGKPCRIPRRGWGYPQYPDPEDPKKPSFQRFIDESTVVWGVDEKTAPRIKRFLHELDTQVSKSVIRDNTSGERELTNLTGKPRSFPNPKPTSLIARFILQTTDEGEWIGDFTVGSGTTAHAISEAFRADRQRRRFFLTELGEDFEKTFLPRMKRVFAARRWRNGVPESMDGMGIFCKVLNLEQYEDTLENCTLKPETSLDIATRLKAVEHLTSFPELYRDQFLAVLPHLVETASPALLLNLENDWLTRPFDFRLKILEEGRWVEKVMDLPETFSMLLGQEITRVVRSELNGKPRLIVEGAGVVCYWREFAPEDINANYVRSDMRLLAEHAKLDGRALYINGIAQHHAKGWLPGNAEEILYTLRALMMKGVEA